jgi:hypothetical protein
MERTVMLQSGWSLTGVLSVVINSWISDLINLS